jgi:ketosteroid isomerase-like protein
MQDIRTPQHFAQATWQMPTRLAAIVLALVSVVSAQQPANPTANVLAAAAARDTDDIRDMIGKYAESVSEANTSLASQVWLNSPEVSFIHPLGHEHGFEQIKQNVYTHLMGDTFSERKLSVHDIAIHVYGDAAWAEFYWDFAARFRKDGSPVATHGRETQIYRKTFEGWRLVHVHYSGMPAPQQNTSP